MTTYYWLGAASTLSDEPTNWATVSGDMGSAGHGVNPGAGGSHKVVFDGALTMAVHSFDDTNIDFSTNRITINSHGFSTNAIVWLMENSGTGASYPTAIAGRTDMYIIAVDANTISLAASSGGSAVSLAGAKGSFKVRMRLDCDMDNGADFSEIEIKSTFCGSVNIAAGESITARTGLTLNGDIKAGGSGAIVNLTTSAASGYGMFMVKNGQYARITNPQHLTYAYANTQNPTYFDDGPYPNVSLTGASGTAVNYRPQYSAPTSSTFDYYDNAKATFYSLNIVGRSSNPITFQPASTTTETDDGAKEFKITSDAGFTCTIPLFDAGYSTWDFQASSGGFALPVTGSSSYSSAYGNLVSKIRKIKAHASTAGHKVTLGEGDILTCESIEIDDGCVLKGPAYNATHSAEIQSVKAPVIKGSWNFAQVAPGLYRSPLSLLTSENRTPHHAHISLGTSVTNFATSAAYTICPLDTVDFDTASAWDNTNRKWVVPRNGVYLVAMGATVRYVTSSHSVIVQLQKNGDTTGVYRGNYGKDSSWISNGTLLLELVKGDYLQLFCYHDGGSGKNLIGNATSPNQTFLSIMEVL